MDEQETSGRFCLPSDGQHLPREQKSIPLWSLFVSDRNESVQRGKCCKWMKQNNSQNIQYSKKVKKLVLFIAC